MAFSFYFFDVYRISLLYLSNLTPHTMHSVRKQRLRVSKHTRRPSTRTRKQRGGQKPSKRTPSKRTPSKRTPSKRTPSKKDLTKQLTEDIHTRIKTLWLSGDESSRKEFFILLQQLAQTKFSRAPHTKTPVQLLQSLNPASTKGTHTLDEVCAALWEDRSESGRLVFTRKTTPTWLSFAMNTLSKFWLTCFGMGFGGGVGVLLGKNSKNDVKQKMLLGTGIIVGGYGGMTKLHTMAQPYYTPQSKLVKLTKQH